MEYGLGKQLNDAVYLARKGDERARGAEIVFLHGLQVRENENTFFETWLSEDGRDLWPKSWLAESFPTAAIYLVRYDSSTWKGAKSGRLDMFTTAEYLLQNLLAAEIGQSPRNPVLLIGQDVGGLVIKQICLHASSEASISDSTKRMAHKQLSFLKQVKGVFYFSTPHGGLHIWGGDGEQLDGELMRTLGIHDADTARTNEKFRELRQKYKWRADGLGASLPGQVEVNEASARYDVDNFCMINASTTNISRFRDRTSTSFVLLTSFIGEMVSRFKNPDRVRLPFRADIRFVPLEQTVRKIRQRLESADICDQVVVLWGDAGTGKSSLVKYLALQYEVEEDIESKSTFLDGIFYFECGRGTDAVSVLRKVLRELQVPEDTIPFSDVDQMCFLLRKRLQNLNALMIFDDVLDDHRKSFVEKVVVPQAEHVKYLLTSQQSAVWSDYKICLIEKIDLKTSQDIIVKHARLRDDKIPMDDEEIINEIISATDHHPLALATIANSVEKDSEGLVSRAEWEHLKQKLLSYLEDSDGEAVKANIFGALYPWSVYAAMMNAVDILFAKNRTYLHIMCIMALFEGSFPTSVFHMFMSCIPQPEVSNDVKRLIKTLKGRLLVEDALEKTVVLATYLLLMVPQSDRSILLTLPCLKMHGLRQKFILSCAKSARNLGRSTSESVEFIKEALSPFLSGANDGGAHALEPSERHDFNPSALSTALCALYGVDEVKKAAVDKLSRCQLTILVLPNPRFDIADPRTRLEMLMCKIEEHMHCSSTSTKILLALKKVVWKYIFELHVDDDNVSFLVSEAYEGALHFLTSATQIGNLIPMSALAMTSSTPSFMVAAFKLLQTEMRPNLKSLSVLTLLMNVVCCIDESYPSFIIDLFDLEVLINLLHRVHNFDLVFPMVLLKILRSLTKIQSGKWQWVSLLRSRPSLQEVIKTVRKRLVDCLNSNVEDWNLLKDDDRNLLDRKYSDWEMFLHTRIAFQVGVVLDAMQLLTELQNFGHGDDEVVATVNAISKPLQAIVRSLARSPAHIHTLEVLECFHLITQETVRGRSTAFWSIPSVMEGIVSLVCPNIQWRSRPLITNIALCILTQWIHSDDGVTVRSCLFSQEGFVDVLLEVIGDHREFDGKYPNIEDQLFLDPKRWTPPLLHVPALAIIEAFVTGDGPAASVLVSLPKLHLVLSDLLMVNTNVPTRRSLLRVLFHLGYSIVDSNDMKSCSHLQVVLRIPEHSQRAVVGSPAVDVHNAFDILLDVIQNKGQKNAQVAAVDLLLHLVATHSSARACIYARPTAVNVLALLLHDDDVDVREKALDTILTLSETSESDLAIGFIRKIVQMSDVVEKMILNLVKHNWAGRVPSITAFVGRYLELEPENPSIILVVQDIVQAMLVSIGNKRHGINQTSYILLFLQLFCRSRKSKSLSFFLSIRGSVEAVIALLCRCPQWLDQVIPGSMRTQFLHLTDTCFCILHELATASEEAMSRIVAMGTGRALDLMLDLLDRKQRQTVQMRTLDFLSDLAASGRSCDAVFQMMERPDFIEKFSLLLHRADPGDLEKGKWFVMKFPLVLASRYGNALPQKMIELVSGALQDSVDLLSSINEEQVPGVLESLLSLVDLLTSINGAQVPKVLESLLSSVKRCKMLRDSILKASGVVESLLSFSIHHPQGSVRAIALHILNHSCTDKEFTPSLARVLVDALPGILDQLEFEGREFAVQVSVVSFLDKLTKIGSKYDSGRTSFFRTKLTSHILYNPRVLQNFAGLLLTDELDYIHKDVMCVLYLTADRSVKGLSLIVQIPGIFERVVELTCRGDYYAFKFLRSVIIYKVGSYELQYLLKCLVRIVSKNIVKNSKIVSGAIELLGDSALRNNNALRYLIEMFHKNMKHKLRAIAMNHLINYASDRSPESSRKTVLISLQSLVFHLRRDDYSESVYELQMEVLCVLDNLAKSSFHNQLRMAKCMTGIYAHDLQIHMHMRTPNLKRERCMDSCCMSVSYLWSMLSTMGP